MKKLEILIYLGKMGAFSKTIPVTTKGLAEKIGETQQNVSRWLVKMEDEGLIYRHKGIKGYLVQITPDGAEYMKRVKMEIELALKKKNELNLVGVVTSGLGDGRYYMSIEEYTSQIKEKFGFLPYPGTLNIKLRDVSSIHEKEKLAAAEGVKIDGFNKYGRVFGSLECFSCTLNGEKCVLVIPERSHHPFDIIEIISPHNLREKLDLEDGKKASITVMLNETNES